MSGVSTNMANVAALADRFDCFILDQYGVLHNGVTPYPGALECLLELRNHGKTILILSNSGKRSAENEDRLERLGFAGRPWNYFVSSGEVAWRQLAAGDASESCYLISRDNDRSAIEGLSMSQAERPEDAGVVLLTGSEGDRYDLSHYEVLLSKAAQRRVPCLCTNPDKIMLTPSGPKFGAGRIAELYASIGGPVTYVGKPYPAIYDAALAAMGNPDKSRVICIGDSVEHDIAGASAAGLQSALVRTGIHADSSADELENEFKNQKARPDCILPGLVW
jgi:HAD superfamily hydrolase (TIGR01459 family)